MASYQYTNNWFEQNARPVWDTLIEQLKPKKILEVGSFEGAAVCYLIDKLGGAAELDIHCVDNWEGGLEHQAGGFVASDMSAVEQRFDANINMAINAAQSRVVVTKHKLSSDLALAKLLTEGRKNQFDFIYIDGSHQAPDVLCDAVLAFRLLRAGGVMAFDDYLWAENLPYGKDPLRCPKPAIDAFTNLYCRKLNVLAAPLQQLYIQKVSD